MPTTAVPVLTTASTVRCGPVDLPGPPHGGTVTTKGNRRLTIKSQPILTAAGVANQPITGCTPIQNTPDKPCTTVSSVTVDAAARITVDGDAVLLATLTGTTDGTVGGTTPQTLLAAKAEHTRLREVKGG